MQENNVIKPQDGFQVAFLSSQADIVIGGGAAGAGKTFAELLEPLRHKDVEGFNAICFRRTTVQIRNPGGLWDESSSLYPYFGAGSNSQHLSWYFPAGSMVKFAHLEHEKTIYDHQGAQYCLIIFDELTHFTRKQFFYLLSRNRSTCGVKPYIRATCNPDPDSFVAELISWWIDQNEKLDNGEPNPQFGFPIPERAGVIRYLVIEDENYIWGDTKQEVIDKAQHIFSNPAFKGINLEHFVKSVTFIPGSIYGNKELLKKNPEYLANLLAQDADEKSRLLDGNWKIRVDERSLCHPDALKNIFSNYPEENTESGYITCDAARFGRDFAVIMVWKGWEMIHLVVYKKSDVHDIVGCIERLRAKFHIPKNRVIVDQDGVGGDTVAIGGYRGFNNNGHPMRDPESTIKENYKNLKTQCYYRTCLQRVNNFQMRLTIRNENCEIWEDGKLHATLSTKIKVGAAVKDVRDLITEDLRSMRRDKTDIEGKLHIISKEEQKTILGRSPDFGDCIMMREFFTLDDREDYGYKRRN